MAAVSGQTKPAPMTTERIQEMLEENFKFIKAIAEQQNLGRVQDVNQFQQKLQENLMLLAAVADAYANTPAGGTVQAAPAQAARPAAPPAAAVLPVQYPAGVGLQQQQQQQQQPQAQMMVAPGAQGQAGAQPTVQLTQQQIQAAVQQAIARQQLQQQQQQQQQPFQLQQALQQQALAQQQGLPGVGPLGGPLAAQGAGAVQVAAGGFQLPAPPPLNLGM